MNPREKMNNKDRPSFPISINASDWSGLTKREYFAALAMHGICASGIPGNHHSFKDIAFMAVAFADDLLTELSKEE